MLAYLLVFLSAWLETIPIIGAVVPGSTVIFALGGLVPSGSLKITPLMIAAVVGAALGDSLAYLFGHWQKRRMLSVWPLSKYPKLVAESEAFFRRNGTLWLPGGALRAADRLASAVGCVLAALTYFVVNTGLVAGMVGLKLNSPI